MVGGELGAPPAQEQHPVWLLIRERLLFRIPKPYRDGEARRRGWLAASKCHPSPGARPGNRGVRRVNRSHESAVSRICQPLSKALAGSLVKTVLLCLDTLSKKKKTKPAERPLIAINVGWDLLLGAKSLKTQKPSKYPSFSLVYLAFTPCPPSTARNYPGRFLEPASACSFALDSMFSEVVSSLSGSRIRHRLELRAVPWLHRVLGKTGKLPQHKKVQEGLSQPQFIITNYTGFNIKI